MDLASELKKLWCIRVTVILFVVGAPRKDPIGLGKNWRKWKSEEEWRPSKQKHCDG